MNPSIAIRYPKGGSTKWLGDGNAAVVLRAEFFGAEVSDAGYVEVWLGTSWVRKPLKVWNGSAWVIKPLKYWNGTTWSNS